MDSARSMISSSAVPFRAASDGGGQVFLFGGGGGGGFLRGLPLVGGGSAAAGAGAGAGAADGARRKRAFQLTTAHEELLQLELGDDEVCGGLDYELLHGPQQQERAKRRLTAEQVRELELSFAEEKRKLEPERKSELARRLGIAPRQVAVWFQNRRARWRTKQLEQDFDRLRAAHHDLLAGRDALLADNDRLRSQVITLTEKLQAKESSASEPEEQTVAAQETIYTLFEENKLCSEIATGSATAPAVVGSNDSPESYFAGARSPPSSPEDDDCGCGCGADDRTFFLPDATLLATAMEQGLERAAEEDEAQLNNWAWIWNDQQY